MTGYIDVLGCIEFSTYTVLHLFYSISRKTFISYVSCRVEWIAQKFSWRTFPSNVNKHTTLNMWLWRKNCLEGSQKKGYISYHPKNTSTFFSFPAFHYLSQPYSTILSRSATGLAGRTASRAPETVTLNIPKSAKETKGAEKDEQDPKDLVSRPEQWFKWWIEIMTMESLVEVFLKKEASPRRLWKGMAVNQRVMKTNGFSLQTTHLM